MIQRDTPLVQCVHAGIGPECADCPHGVPHNREAILCNREKADVAWPWFWCPAAVGDLARVYCEEVERP